jgi:hypothetical protein
MIKPIRIIKDALAVTSLAVISVAAFIKYVKYYEKKYGKK